MGTGTGRATLKVGAAAVVALAIPALTVAWLAFLLLRSDRELDRQRLHERLEAAATVVGGVLERRLAATEQQLVRLADAAPEARAAAMADFRLSPADGAAVVFEGAEAWAWPPPPFMPGPPASDEEDAMAFIDAEVLEFGRGDLAAAAAAYKTMAESPDPARRAGALARLARVARRRGDTRAALAAYDRLAAHSAVMTLGRPADLLAMTERVALLAEAGDAPRVAAAARPVQEALLAGRWRLSESEFAFHRSRLAGWSGDDRLGHASAHPRLAVATAVAQASDLVSRAGADVEGGRTAWTNAHGRGLLVWRRVGQRVVALVAIDEWARRTWLGDVRATATGQRARASLTTADGREWLDAPARGAAVRYTPEEGRLPFVLRVSSADPTSDAATFAGRRRLLAGMVAALGVLMAASGYVAARGLAREVAAARLQSDFVAAVSHEFRTPVASMRQLGELLDEGRVPDEAKRREYYGRIRRQAARLHHLVENLLDFGRMEAQAAEYRMTRLEPATLVRDVVAEFDSAGRGIGRQVDVAMPGALPPIVGDSEALGRALWNLLDNAAKYSPDATPIHVQATVTAGRLAIVVRDAGPGIPPDEQARIFERFARGSHALASGARGTGLGLAMVRHIVHAHKGAVTVDSRPGAGATFTITLPTAAPLHGRPATETSLDPG